MARFISELEAAVGPLRREFLSAAFFRRLNDGSLTRQHYAKPLTEIYHYVKHSTRLLALAAGHTSPLRSDLFRRFVAHIGEESGHEMWALADLEAVGADPQQVIVSTPAPYTDAMVALQYFLIQHISPLAVLGYIYALETLGSGSASAVAELYQVADEGVPLWINPSSARGPARADARSPIADFRARARARNRTRSFAGPEYEHEHRFAEHEHDRIFASGLAK